MLVVKSYSYMNLLLGYGPKKEVSCNIYWSVQSHGFRLTFVGGMSAVNGHSMMRDQLAQHLNQQHSITQIAQILHETYNPLSSIAKLPVLPFLGIPVSTFSCYASNIITLFFDSSALRCQCYRFACWHNLRA